MSRPLNITDNIIGYLSLEAEKISSNVEINNQYKIEIINAISEILLKILDISNEEFRVASIRPDPVGPTGSGPVVASAAGIGPSLESLFKYDANKKSSQIYEILSNCNEKEMSLFKVFLKHKSVDRLLDKEYVQKNDCKEYRTTTFPSFILLFTYPILAILPRWLIRKYPALKRLVNSLFIYPRSNFISTGGTFYTFLFLCLFQLYGQEMALNVGKCLVDSIANEISGNYTTVDGLSTALVDANFNATKFVSCSNKDYNFDSSNNSNIIITCCLFILLIIMFLSKIKEEHDEFKAKGKELVVHESETDLSYKDRIKMKKLCFRKPSKQSGQENNSYSSMSPKNYLKNPRKFTNRSYNYFFDIWNKIDIMCLIFTSLYLVVTFILLVIGILLAHTKLIEKIDQPYKYLKGIVNCQKILVIPTVIGYCLSMSQLCIVSKTLGNATEATIIMATRAISYIGVVSFYWIGLFFLGTIIIDASFLEVSATFGKIVFGIAEYSDFSPIFLKDTPGVIYFILSLVIMIVLTMNGLISIMTLSLNNDISDEKTRQRENYNRWKWLNNRQPWFRPFNLFFKDFDMIEEQICEDSTEHIVDRDDKLYTSSRRSYVVENKTNNDDTSESVIVAILYLLDLPNVENLVIKSVQNDQVKETVLSTILDMNISNKTVLKRLNTYFNDNPVSLIGNPKLLNQIISTGNDQMLKQPSVKLAIQKVSEDHDDDTNNPFDDFMKYAQNNIKDPQVPYKVSSGETLTKNRKIYDFLEKICRISAEKDIDLTGLLKKIVVCNINLDIDKCIKIINNKSLKRRGIKLSEVRVQMDKKACGVFNNTMQTSTRQEVQEAQGTQEKEALDRALQVDETKHGATETQTLAVESSLLNYAIASKTTIPETISLLLLKFQCKPDFHTFLLLALSRKEICESFKDGRKKLYEKFEKERKRADNNSLYKHNLNKLNNREYPSFEVPDCLQDRNFLHSILKRINLNQKILKLNDLRSFFDVIYREGHYQKLQDNDSFFNYVDNETDGNNIIHTFLNRDDLHETIVSCNNSVCVMKSLDQQSVRKKLLETNNSNLTPLAVYSKKKLKVCDDKAHNKIDYDMTLIIKYVAETQPKALEKTCQDSFTPLADIIITQKSVRTFKNILEIYYKYSRNSLKLQLFKVSHKLYLHSKYETDLNYFMIAILYGKFEVIETILDFYKEKSENENELNFYENVAHQTNQGNSVFHFIGKMSCLLDHHDVTDTIEMVEKIIEKIFKFCDNGSDSNREIQGKKLKLPSILRRLNVKLIKPRKYASALMTKDPKNAKKFKMVADTFKKFEDKEIQAGSDNRTNYEIFKNFLVFGRGYETWQDAIDKEGRKFNQMMTVCFKDPNLRFLGKTAVHLCSIMNLSKYFDELDDYKDTENKHGGQDQDQESENELTNIQPDCIGTSPDKNSSGFSRENLSAGSIDSPSNQAIQTDVMPFRIEKLKCLLKTKISQVRDNEGLLPVYYAVSSNRLDIVKILFKHCNMEKVWKHAKGLGWWWVFCGFKKIIKRSSFAVRL